jgi:hypothetical protein
MASKLHELLAVEGNLAGQAQKMRTELITTTFDKKRHHFGAKRITFKPLAEGAADVTEEQSDIQTSVRAELKWIGEILAKAWDASHCIDLANATAKADLVTEEGATLVKSVPATSLLALEKSIQELHALLAAVPTLDPAKGFQQDPQREPGVFKAREVSKTRTKKMNRAMVMYEATPEHPAQVQLVTEDVPTGTILEQEWSSLVTPVTKSEMLDRCDRLLRAVKRARAKANETEIDQESNKIGQTLLEYVLSPLNGLGI